MTPTPALELRSVTVRWHPQAAPVVQQVTFTVAPGERVALMGRNGSGKTSLLLSVVGIAPFEGTIRVAGTEVSSRTAATIRRQLGFLLHPPEDQLLFPEPLEDVAWGLLQRGEVLERAHERATRVLASLGAGGVARRRLWELSCGEKQRVALAGTLVTEPPLLLLDEPSAGLDPPGRWELAQLLAGLPAAMLIATHDLDFAAHVCQRFLLLEGGRLAGDDADLSYILRRWGVPPRVVEKLPRA